MEGQASRTAMMAAVVRGRHRLDHDYPWVLDDPYALPLVGSGWGDLRAALTARLPPDVFDGLTAAVVTRARYAEDRVRDCLPGQYVILGAGLDSFAWRRPDLLRAMRIFEVDHPLTQAWKQDRIAALALPGHGRHLFVPVDFTTVSLDDRLRRAGFDPGKPSVVSWSGGSLYLTREQIRATLVSANLGPGAQLVMDYAFTNAQADEVGRLFFDLFTPLAEQSGEPVVGRLSPGQMSAVLGECGFQVVDQPTVRELAARYFAGRRDGLRLPAIGTVITAAAR